MRISELIGETTDYDKKQALEEKRPKSWCKSISAFANGEGGALIFGITDENDIIGLADPESDAEKISEIIKTHIEPIPNFKLRFQKASGKTLIILDVFKGEETPYYYAADGVCEAYIRIGNESVRVSAAEQKRLVMRGKNATYDSQLSGCRIEDYAFSKLRARYKQWSGNSFEDRDMISFGLVSKDGILTNAGTLLADDSPVNHSRVFCTRWNGNDKSSGSVDALDDAEYTGSLITLVEDGEAFIRRNLRVMWRKTAASREEMPEYVERSFHEALINALVHRDYLISGSEVHIDIFDDRMEIYSPGGMPDGSNIQDRDPLQVPSVRRNPVIADVFARLGLMERKGSGFAKIIDAYEHQHSYSESKRPVFRSDRYQFTVIMPNLNYGITEPGSNPNQAANQANQGTNRETGIRGRLIDRVRQNPAITQNQLSKDLNIPSGTVKYYMAQLKRQGIITREGTSQNGRWIVNEAVK